MTTLRQAIAKRIWWFDLIYPITLAAILFASLTAVVYSGRRSSRLSAMAEAQLLEFSLRLNPRAVVAPSKDVLIVSVMPTELRSLSPAPLGTRPEASAAEYARVIEALALQGVSHIFVSWDLAAHPDDEIYYLPLIDVAQRHKGGTEVAFAVTSNQTVNFPKKLAAHVTLLTDDLCADRPDTAVFCPLLATYQDWIIYKIMAVTGVVDAEGKPSGKSRSWFTETLPMTSPSMALNLAAAERIRHLSFTQVLRQEGLRAVDEPARLAFVGADNRGASAGGGDSRFMRTIYDSKAIDVGVGGTPYHVFWAQVAEMATTDAALRFPPDWVRIPLTFGVCVGVLGITFTLGGIAALGLLTIYGAAGIALNAFVGLPLLRFVPLFDSLYFGFATLVFAGAVRVSYMAYRKWRVQAQRRSLARTADLKANFVSLVSHNLNTPVAKMQGMIALLAPAVASPDDKARLREAQRLVTRLELTIRYILVTLALDEGQIAEQSKSLRGLWKELESGALPTLRKLGVDMTLAAPEDEDGALDLPVVHDPKLLAAALSGVGAYYAGSDGPVRARWRTAVEDDGTVSLTVEAEGPRAGEESFLQSLALGLLQKTAASYGGLTTTTEAAGAAGLRFHALLRPPGATAPARPLQDSTATAGA